jgi:hypothetical protein
MTDGHSSAAVFYRKKNENVTGHPDDDLEYMFWQTVTVSLCHLSVEPLIWTYVLLLYRTGRDVEDRGRSKNLKQDCTSLLEIIVKFSEILLPVVKK